MRTAAAAAVRIGSYVEEYPGCIGAGGRRHFALRFCIKVWMMVVGVWCVGVDVMNKDMVREGKDILLLLCWIVSVCCSCGSG